MTIQSFLDGQILLSYKKKKKNSKRQENAINVKRVSCSYRLSIGYLAFLP